MSSPNHPTSDIEDAFSSNFPDYIPASPEYFPASPGNTSLILQIIYLNFFPRKEIPPPKDTKTPVESPIPISPSSLVGSSSLVRSTTPPPNYPFDESIFAELDNSLWIILRPLGSEPVLQEFNDIKCLMAPKRTSTSAAPPMTQAAIKKLVVDSVVAALEAQAANYGKY
ncbi:hypothetical protein Tco_0860091 [Tanacetum coccineum]|uniref:Uncharacterized protein n=1 Tax=Tanacetum coccineum TaxID=301880 RepID=A0ABQ5BHX3_9ASTR